MTSEHVFPDWDAFLSEYKHQGEQRMRAHRRSLPPDSRAREWLPDYATIIYLIAGRPQRWRGTCITRNCVSNVAWALVRRLA